MSTTTLGVALSGLGQAGRPTMQSVRWHSPHFTENLMSVPRPTLVMLDQLYINWGHTPMLLSPLLVYGDGLTYATKLQSGGNSFLMFAGEQGWIPVADHLHQSAPGLVVRFSHIHDYALLWRRAEVAVRVLFDLPRRYAHDDPRLGACWRTGEDLSTQQLGRNHRRKISQAKRKWQASAEHMVEGGESVSLWTNSGNMEASFTPSAALRSSLSGAILPIDGGGNGNEVDPQDASDSAGESCLMPTVLEPVTQADLVECSGESWLKGSHRDEVAAVSEPFDPGSPRTSETPEESVLANLEPTNGVTTRQHDPPPTAHFDSLEDPLISPNTQKESSPPEHQFSGRLEVMWTVNPAGERCLEESSRARYQPLTDLSKFYTSRKKNVQRIGQLQYMENRCSYCGSGMVPPSIQRCTRCNKHWMHTYCSPMLVSVSGLPNFCCSGCSLGVAPHKVHGTPECSLCSTPICDNAGGLECQTCYKFHHVLCLMVECPQGCPEFTAEFFSSRRLVSTRWTCGKCRKGSMEPIGEPDSWAMEVHLPLRAVSGKPKIIVGVPFGLRISSEHTVSLPCRWTDASLALELFSEAARSMQILITILYPGLATRTALMELGRNNSSQARVLMLQTEQSKGSQVVAFAIYGQTQQGGPPFILYQGVHPYLQNKGIGLWTLQLLYERCGGPSRELLVRRWPKREAFYTHTGFVPAADNLVRFPNVGDGQSVMRRPAIQGAPIGTSLMETITVDPATQSALCPWVCRSTASFSTSTGKDACFALTLLQLIIRVPQLVRFFAEYSSDQMDTGMLVSRILGHMWSGQQDLEGPALVHLLRARLQMQLGQSTSRRKGGPAGFQGQQDPEELFFALKRYLESPPHPLGSSPDLSDTSAFATLLTWEGLYVAKCQKCHSIRWQRANRTEFHCYPTDSSITSTRQLFNLILNEEGDTTPRSACVVRGCYSPLVCRSWHPTKAAPVLALQIVRTAGPDRRHTGRVDIPRRLMVWGGSEVVRVYLLRAVCIHFGSTSCQFGHYTAGRIHQNFLEQCSQLPSGAVLTTHEIPDEDYLNLQALKPPLSGKHVVTMALYSEAMDGEPGEADQVTHELAVDFTKVPSDLPSVADMERDDSLVEQLAGRGNDTKRPRVGASVSGTSPTFLELCQQFSRLVPPQEHLRLERSEDSQTAYAILVRELLQQAEASVIPAFFWSDFPTNSLSQLATELCESKALLLSRRSTASAGRGGLQDLRSAAQLMSSEKGRSDPFTSTNARAGGMYDLREGTSILRCLAESTGVEASGGCGLLISGCGVTTDCHFHSLPVLQRAFFAVKVNESGDLVIRIPELQGTFPCVKRCIFIDPDSLEEAGIHCYAIDSVQHLSSLIKRIGDLSPGVRSGIRWFHGSLDGTSTSSFYLPAKMMHWITTQPTGEKNEGWIFCGAATEVIPTCPNIRRLVQASLLRPAPTGDSAAGVIHLKHLRAQTTTAFTWELLNKLIEDDGSSVCDFPDWYQLEAINRVATLLTNLWPSPTELNPSKELEQGLLQSITILQACRLQSHEVMTNLHSARQGVSDYLIHPLASTRDIAATELVRLRSALDHGRKL